MSRLAYSSAILMWFSCCNTFSLKKSVPDFDVLVGVHLSLFTRSGPMLNALWTPIHEIDESEQDSNKRDLSIPESLQHNLTLNRYIEYLLDQGCQKVWCTGRFCSIIRDTKGCHVCVCPLGSLASGCNGMNQNLYVDLTTNGCPTISENGSLQRYPAKLVRRWFREIDKETNVDECREFEFPYCPELDVNNLLTGPETENQCRDLCYWGFPQELEDLH